MARIARIAKTLPARQPKPQPWLRDRAHLDWIGALPCLSCGRRPPCQAAHIRLQTDGAAGRKPSDNYVAPLCARCHARQHRIGEQTFWAQLMEQGVSDPWGVAQRLWRISGDTERGYLAIAHARPGLQTAWLN